MKATDWTGLAADLLTLGGAIVLAWDAVKAVEHFADEQRRLKTLKSFAGQIRLETEDGRPLRTEDDAHLASLRKVSKWAKIGGCVLLAGYFLQLLTRFIDILSPDR